MSPEIKDAIRASARLLSEQIERHRATPQVTLAAHIRYARKQRAAQLGSRHLIYLDSNAWKCLADFEQGKPRLTDAMTLFATTLKSAAATGKFLFPIGLPTFFELDSMTNEETHDSLASFVDQLSQGYCLAPFHERVGEELANLRARNFSEAVGLEEFLRSPVELLGVPAATLDLEVRAFVDEVTFGKALFDVLTELPFSLQLEVARTSPGAKWSNSRGIKELNEGKAAHQAAVTSFNAGMFLELKGGIEAWHINEGTPIAPQEVTLLAMSAFLHWLKNPASRSFPTIRTLSSLYGLMRFDPQRRYKDGDPNDFMAAAAALPAAEAMFTDRRLARILSDRALALDAYTSCAVVAGFDEMATYLTNRLQ